MTLTVVALALALTACGGPAATTTAATPARTDAVTRRAPPTTSGTDLTTSGGNAAACTLEHVYFGYDVADLDAAARATLAGDATCLRERPEQTVTLVGGTDERGTEEYNLSLGDRRARSVRSYLERSGVASERMSVSSMGEEWSAGSDEAAMARDRRVEARPR